MSSRDNTYSAPATIPSQAITVSHQNQDEYKKINQIVQRTLYEISRLSPQKQVAVGGVSGVVAGYCFAKASKAVAFAIGASVLGLALAKQSGFVEIHFDRIRDTANQQINSIQRAAILSNQQAATTNIDGEEVQTSADRTSHNFIDSVKNFAITNLAITSSFIGGFLLGVAFE